MRPVPFPRLGKVRLREGIRLVPGHKPGTHDDGVLWALHPGTQFERTVAEHLGKAGIGSSASLWDEALEGRIFACSLSTPTAFATLVT